MVLRIFLRRNPGGTRHASRLQDFARPFFPRDLFTVSLEGLSESESTLSLVLSAV